ncbi:uncharacterized protein RHO25_008026 [Cercospora beticola]|uniref:Uncharacterized protein n=1 Tax=Cercospora beticola TaxID=122368 RepID=A0ABZ0NUV9_CERBT|nr:hypothetical protein RHO25_008026 [Cercospora beticola]
MYFFFEKEIGKCGAGWNHHLRTGSRKIHGFFDVASQYRVEPTDCTTLFPLTNGVNEYFEHIMLERGVLTDLNLFFKNMHFTAATRNYQDYKLPFNKAVRKRSEALVNSHSVVGAGDPNHKK